MGHRRHLERSDVDPNLIALVGLSGVVVKLTREHFAEKNHELQ